MKKLTIYLVLLLMVAGGCKKYEEGPLISLRSKDARLCREWKLEKYTINGEEEIIGLETTLEFKEDGSLTDTYHYVDLGDIVYTAKWRFAQDKKYIEITELNWEGKKSFPIPPSILKNTSEDEWTEYEILRLTAKEFFMVQHHHTGNKLRFEYKAK